MLSERLNYSALHGLRHVGSMGSGLFGTSHFLSGYNRSIMSPSPMQPMSNPNMILYNAANSIRPFQIPTSSSIPLHPLSTDFGVLAAAAAAGPSTTSNAAAIAMQAAAAQAANYQNSLKSAAHLVHEMKTARLENIEANTNSPNILASLSQQHGNLDRHSLFPGLSSALTSSNMSSIPSRNSPPLSLCTSRTKLVSELKDIN